MPDGVSFDYSDLNRLGADLGGAEGDLAGPLKSALSFGATNVKKEAQRSVSADRFFKAAAPAITYDVKVLRSAVEAEVGYDKGRAAGQLGNLREYGAPAAQAYGNPFAPTTPLAPSNDLANALEHEQADFEHGIDLAVNDALKKAGL